jgi:ribosome-associated protein
MLKKVLDRIVELAEEKKAEGNCYYDLTADNLITDYIVVMNASNRVHINGLLEALISDLPKLTSEDTLNFFSQYQIAGTAESEWIILDLNSIIVHIMTTEKREYYKIDKLFASFGPVYHL